MNSKSRRYLGGLYLTIVLGLWLVPSEIVFSLNARSEPSIYNLAALNDIKNNQSGYPQLIRFLKDADSLIQLKPLSVIDKKKKFVPNENYYCSISRYAWPNPDDPDGPYIIKDGRSNPEYAEYNGIDLDGLANRLKHRCVAYYITENEVYRKAIVKQLNVWFLDKRTRMLPNFEYAQVLPGVNDNKGQSYGLAELSRFTSVLESIMLFDYGKGLKSRERRKLKAWFLDFQDWLLKSRQWHIVSKANNNNITSSSYLALVEMSLFIGNTYIAKGLARDFNAKIIEVQIDDEGKQPAELRRADGFGYSVGNLEIIIDFCLVMERMGFTFYKDYQNRINAAFEYLYQFVDNHEAFPYQQKASWGFYERRLLKNMKRLLRLSSDDTTIKTIANQIVLNESYFMDAVY